MAAFRPEEQDVRLQDVVLVEDDVERGGQGNPAGRARMFVQQQEHRLDGELVPRQRRRHDDELPPVNLVAAPVGRHGQKVGVADQRLHVLHGRHGTTRKPCRSRAAARVAPAGRPADRRRGNCHRRAVSAS